MRTKSKNRPAAFFLAFGASVLLLAGVCTLSQAGAIAAPRVMETEPLGPPPGPQARPRPEEVLIYRDDMRNGRFDAFVPEGAGTGSYAVVDDGGGNLAARLAGGETLKMHPTAATSPNTWEGYDILVRVKRSGEGTVAFGLRWARGVDKGYWLENTGDEWSLVRGTSSGSGATTLSTVSRPTPRGEWFDLRIEIRSTPAGARVKAYMDCDLFLNHVDPDPIPFGGVRFRTQGETAVLWLDDFAVVGHVDSRYTWSQMKGPEGGLIVDIAVDPRDWRVAYAGALDGGLFKTTDGGATWKEVGLPGELWKIRIYDIELAPSNPDVVYVGVGAKHMSAFWRSDNGGVMWKWTGAEKLDEEGGVHFMAVDPSDPMHVFLSFGAPQYPAQSGLYESEDGGATLTLLPTGGGEIGPVAIDPGNSDHVLAAPESAIVAGSSLLSSTDGGDTWARSDTGMNGDDIREILFYPPDPRYVLARSHDGPVYRSVDRGATWTTIPTLPGAIRLRFSPRTPPAILAFRGSGLYTSTDQGATFSLSISSSCASEIHWVDVGTDNPDVVYSAAYGTQLTVSMDLGQTCTPSEKGLLAHPVEGLGVDPANSNVVYAGTLYGLFKSFDGGATWSWVRRGERYTAIAVDPLDGETVYIGNGEKAEVLKSTDGGATWTDVTGTITFPGIAALTIDPRNHLTVYAGTGHGPQGLPTGAGLYRTTDGGGSWEKIPSIPDVEVAAVTVHPADSSRVAAATMGYGVYVSTDGGTTFDARNNGIAAGDGSGKMTYALEMDPRNPDVMYVGTNGWYGKIHAASPWNGLYKTTDGGLNWTLLIGAEGFPANPRYPFLGVGGGIDGIVVNPVRPDEVYVAVHDPGLYMTWNGGTDWRWVNHGFVPFLDHSYPYRIAISSLGEALYSSTCGRSVFRNLLTRLETPQAPGTGSSGEGGWRGSCGGAP